MFILLVVTILLHILKKEKKKLRIVLYAGRVKKSPLKELRFSILV